MAGTPIGLLLTITSAVGGGGPVIVTVGQATESDSALGSTIRRTRHPGIATEADSGLGATRVRTKAVGQATETDQAFAAVGQTHVVSVGLATTANSALPATRVKTYHLSFPSEISVALPTAHVKVKGVGFALETDSALSATPIYASPRFLHRMALDIRLTRSTVTTVNTP